MQHCNQKRKVESRKLKTVPRAASARCPITAQQRFIPAFPKGSRVRFRLMSAAAAATSALLLISGCSVVDETNPIAKKEVPKPTVEVTADAPGKKLALKVTDGTFENVQLIDDDAEGSLVDLGEFKDPSDDASEEPTDGATDAAEDSDESSEDASESATPPLTLRQTRRPTPPLTPRLQPAKKPPPISRLRGSLPTGLPEIRPTRGPLRHSMLTARSTRSLARSTPTSSNAPRSAPAPSSATTRRSVSVRPLL